MKASHENFLVILEKRNFPYEFAILLRLKPGCAGGYYIGKIFPRRKPAEQKVKLRNRVQVKERLLDFTILRENRISTFKLL